MVLIKGIEIVIKNFKTPNSDGFTGKLPSIGGTLTGLGK